MKVRKRIMFWVWDGCPDWTPDWFCDAITWTACKVWRHEPIADQCGMSEHDFCCWCQKSMPNMAPRKVSTP